ncbi:hypothetical protein [Mycobacteroides abscessus]|uniref:hypothetical protein n=1 Tax=Mycobacteroides abscessus TaxID=36809 RepID=UPI000C2681D6|nr:hypothetical protein [Mycobacteroides abscessus]MBE5460969.1 hypothetical protein [Mycobacteroides abscessus]QOF41746.1 hypothetical protein E3G69_000768 [Mycobacteroides abscessus]QOF46442.1 hypothetical protein E3G70_000764 [Mycobacteroides abscessus]
MREITNLLPLALLLLGVLGTVAARVYLKIRAADMSFPTVITVLTLLVSLALVVFAVFQLTDSIGVRYGILGGMVMIAVQAIYPLIADKGDTSPHVS